MPADDAADADHDAALAHDLRSAVLRLARRIRANRVDTSLSLSQLSALAVLAVAGPMSAGDLAAVESVQPPTMTKVLAALVERGLITREADASDKRAVRLAVTEAGAAVVDAERRARDAWLSQVLDQLDADQLAALTAALPVLDRMATPDPW
ncbi:MarR family winged helix-turn-helix transcriptional regulator [Jatrophihabitans sp. YIM 134969]